MTPKQKAVLLLQSGAALLLYGLLVWRGGEGLVWTAAKILALAWFIRCFQKLCRLPRLS